MNVHLRDRILRRLDTLPDERLYQILDYVEFLESKYAERQAPAANPFTKFAEGLEDKMRAGRMSASTISETMGLMNKAMGVLSGVAAAGKSVANDIASVATTAASAASTAASQAASGMSSPASTQQQPPPQATGTETPSGATQNTAAPATSAPPNTPQQPPSSSTNTGEQRP